jgi:hypothetical protein
MSYNNIIEEKVEQRNIIACYMERAELHEYGFDIIDRAVKSGWVKKAEESSETPDYGTPDDFNRWVMSLGRGNTSEDDLKIKNIIDEIVIADKEQNTKKSNTPPQHLDGRLLASGVAWNNTESQRHYI